MIHQCYYYGAGGQLIRVSHERLVRYRNKGFTLDSLCLGLMSSTLFDPETGKRLPTYIVAKAESMATGNVNSVDATYEHIPLNYQTVSGARSPIQTAYSTLIA